MSDTEEDLTEKRLKVVLVGDSGVGKTSIAVRFCNDEFTRQYTPTAGIDFFLKNLSIGCYKNLNLHIWDVGGLSLNGDMLDKYVFGAHIIVLVYDVTNSSSFDLMQEWLAEIRDLNDVFQSRPLVAVVGNKCDVEHQRTVKREKSHRFAAENGFPYHDMSARTGESVSLSIANLAAQVLGVRLTRTDQDFHKPVVAAEIGDTVDMPTVQNVVKRQPKKQNRGDLNPNPLESKSSVCSLQ